MSGILHARAVLVIASMVVEEGAESLQTTNAETVSPRVHPARDLCDCKSASDEKWRANKTGHEVNTVVVSDGVTEPRPKLVSAIDPVPHLLYHTKGKRAPRICAGAEILQERQN